MTYPKGYLLVNKENGYKQSEESAAKYVSEHITHKCSAIGDKISEALAFVLKHFSNINELNLNNLLSHYCYNYIGVFNDGIQKYIDMKISDAVNSGFVLEW